jgi:hypothetical protein
MPWKLYIGDFLYMKCSSQGHCMETAEMLRLVGFTDIRVYYEEMLLNIEEVKL